MWSGSPNSEPERSDLRSGRPDLKSRRPNFRSERPDLKPERPDLKPGRPDLGRGGPNSGPERSDFRSERPDLGSVVGGGEEKNGKIALCGFIGRLPLWGRCPKRVILSLRRQFWDLTGLIQGLLGPDWGLRGLRAGGRMDRWTDIWKFTHVSYRILALWSCCPETLTKHLGRSSNAKTAHKRQKS